MSTLSQLEKAPDGCIIAPGVEDASQPSLWSLEWGLLWSMWYRDLLRLAKERSRWLGVVAQPLLFWLFIGSGIGDNFRVAGAGNSSYLTFFFPGILVMVLLFTSIFGTISVIEDKRSGYLQGVLVAPGSRFSMLLGKIMGVSSVSILQALLLTAFAPLAGYPFAEINFMMLFAAVLLASTGLTAINLIIAWSISSVQGYHAIMSILLIPLWILSGAMFPYRDTWIGKVMLANPLSYAVDAVRHALVGARSTLASSSPAVSIGVLLGVLALGLLGATWVCRRK